MCLSFNMQLLLGEGNYGNGVFQALTRGWCTPLMLVFILPLIFMLAYPYPIGEFGQSPWPNHWFSVYLYINKHGNVMCHTADLHGGPRLKWDEHFTTCKVFLSSCLTFHFHSYVFCWTSRTSSWILLTVMLLFQRVAWFSIGMARVSNLCCPLFAMVLISYSECLQTLLWFEWSYIYFNASVVARSYK